MTFRHGKVTKVFYGGYDLTSYLRTANAPRTVDTAECTAFNASVKTYVVGQQSAQMSLEGMFCYDSVALNQLDNVLQIYDPGAEAPVPAAICYDSGSLDGQTCYAGLAHKTSITHTGSVSDIVGTNIDMQLTDTAGTGTILVGNGSAWTLTTAKSANLTSLLPLTVPPTTQFKGGFAAIHILGGASLVGGQTIKFDHSNNGSTWNTLVTWNPVAATSNQYFAAQFNVPIDTQVRFIGTGAGTATVIGYFVPKIQ